VLYALKMTYSLHFSYSSVILKVKTFVICVECVEPELIFISRHYLDSRECVELMRMCLLIVMGLGR